MTTDSSIHGKSPSKSLAVFDTPSLPDGWVGRDVVRIVDPLGKGAAWVDPKFAGLCVGFFVRRHQNAPWLTALSSLTPDEIDKWGGTGLETLWVHPGNPAPVPARSVNAGWAYESRDPTSVTVTGEICGHRVHLTYRCEDGVLKLDAKLLSEEQISGALGIRMHVRGAEVIAGEVGRVDLVRNTLPAWRLQCSVGETMEVHQETRSDMDSVTKVEWIPREGNQSRDEGCGPTYRWSMEPVFGGGERGEAKQTGKR